MTDDTVRSGNMNNIHIALIPDGNRRYAEERGKPVWYGHQIGAKKLEDFLRWCNKYEQIKTVTIFALSTENLNRSEKEVHQLWNIYKKELYKITRSKEIKENGMRVHVLGSEDVWRGDVRQAADDAMKLTAQYSRKVLNILLSYGSQFEIVNAAKRLVEKGIKKTKKITDFFDEYLMVSQPVDLIIRTGNQQRLSNFLLYQSAYAEIYFSKTLWPEFNKKEFDRIMKWYFEQQRKFGR